MSENKDEEDKLIHQFSSGYVGERMPGKDNMFILRNRQGFIAATAEKYNDVITSFRFHKERHLPRHIIDEVVAYIMEAKFRLTKEAAHELGVSILKYEDQREVYLSSRELKCYGLNHFLQPEDKTVAILNSLYPMDLKLKKNSVGCQLDLQGMLIRSLYIGPDSVLDIDLRSNHHIRSVTVDANFSGRLSLSRSSVEYLEIKDNCRAEVFFHDGEKILNIKVGGSFSGSADLKKSYLRRLIVGSDCQGIFNINTCIFYRHIDIGQNYSGRLSIISVFARYLQIGDGFSGSLYGASVSARQGIRSVYVGNGFAGTLDLSSSKTVERVEVGENASGQLIMISSPSIRLVILGANFSGMADFRESALVYASAAENCTGRFECNACANLTLLNMPKENGYKIVGTDKPVKTEIVKNRILYWFIQRSLPHEYFKSYRKSRLRSFFNRFF